MKPVTITYKFVRIATKQRYDLQLKGESSTHEQMLESLQLDASRYIFSAIDREGPQVVDYTVEVEADPAALTGAQVKVLLNLGLTPFVPEEEPAEAQSRLGYWLSHWMRRLNR